MESRQCPGKSGLLSCFWSLNKTFSILISLTPAPFSQWCPPLPFSFGQCLLRRSVHSVSPLSLPLFLQLLPQPGTGSAWLSSLCFTGCHGLKIKSASDWLPIDMWVPNITPRGSDCRAGWTVPIGLFPRSPPPTPICWQWLRQVGQAPSWRIPHFFLPPLHKQQPLWEDFCTHQAPSLASASLQFRCSPAPGSPGLPSCRGAWLKELSWLLYKWKNEREKNKVKVLEALHQKP